MKIFIITDLSTGVPVSMAYTPLGVAREMENIREVDEVEGLVRDYGISKIDFAPLSDLVNEYYEFRKLTNPNTEQSFLFLTSEIGELADAIVQNKAAWVRNNPDLKDGSDKKIREEAGDVLMMLVKTIENYYGDPVADMVKKFKKKGFDNEASPSVKS